MGFLDSLKNFFTGEDNKEYLSGFSKTNANLGTKLRYISKDGLVDSDEFMENLMVTLIDANLGYRTSEKVCSKFLKKAGHKKLNSDEVMDLIVETLKDVYETKEDSPIIENKDGITITMLVGVNGSGKTTTCAKLASYYRNQGKRVALVAADTFRAGAVDQLASWGSKLGFVVIKGEPNEDPSSVIVKGCRYAKENDIDYLLIDTAGRLQNKKNLMQELAKMKKVIGKEIEGGPHNTWLVIDANTGQNGLSQATTFNEATSLSGIILTKMDGTAKGGIVIGIKDHLGLPVRFLTFGETENDLKAFDLNLYLYSVLGDLSNER